MRPCIDTHPVPVPRKCKYCAIYTTNPKMREKWDNDETPGILQKAVNFTKAAFNHLKHGLTILPPEKSQERLNICHSCEMFDGKNTCRHKKCGCQLSVKATWAEQECPLNKWPKLT
jgi:hypothetical protein